MIGRVRSSYAGTMVGYMIFVPTVGTYVFNQIALRSLDASTLAAFWLLLPLFGALGGILRLGEKPGMREALAACFILSGLILHTRKPRSG